jgi:hypothetical protein
MKAKGHIRIENFELGVRVDGARWPDELARDPPPGPAAWATTEIAHEIGEASEFIDATWDGAAIKVTWRPLSLPTKLPGTLSVDFEDGNTPKSAKVEWMSEDRGVRVGSLPWKVDKRPERVVGKGTNARVLFETPVTDTRRSGAGVSPVVPDELSGQNLELLTLVVLEGIYGGILAEEPAPPGNGMPNPPVTKRKTDRGSSGASYAVDWHARARERMTVLDNWAKALSGVSALGRHLVITDGERLLGLWKGRLKGLDADVPEAPGLRVAIREMTARLVAATDKSEDE